MRHLLSIALLLITTNCFAAERYHFKISKVVDGDTLEIDSSSLCLPQSLKLSVRVADVDTPEKGYRAKCDQEKELAKQASDYTKKLVKGAKTISFEEVKWDKYGGRILARVFIDDQALDQLLIEKGLAREYHGGKKESWCLNQ